MPTGRWPDFVLLHPAAGGGGMSVWMPCPLVPGPTQARPWPAARQTLSLRAGMAELVLLHRLHARTRRELNQEVLERAARIIGVTARHWLGDS